MPSKKVKVIRDDNFISFEDRVNGYLSSGWAVSSTSCCTIGIPDSHIFINDFVAILILSED